ncbi:MAG: hypothetical protein HGA55_07780, partial [Methanoregulaceae archaeon]|nr:hypothetical protein [Methanoregulaceae archaeon]
MICFSLSSDLSLLGECQINGSTFPDRDSERCPAKTFRLQVGLRATLECTGECEVETGRLIGADLVVSGAALRFGNRIKLT